MRIVNKNNKLIVWIAGLILLVFLVGSLLFVLSLRQNNQVRIVRYLEEATAQRTTVVTQHIEGGFQLLRGVATGLGQMDLSDTGAIEKLLDDINQSNTFVRMGLADLDGKVDLVDLSGARFDGIDLSSLPAFSQALDGQAAVTPTFYEARTGQFVNYYLVPVYQDGAVVGVLCGVDTEDALYDIMAVAVFQEVGYFSMLDADGIFVSPTADPNPQVEIGASVFDVADCVDPNADAVAEMLRSGTSGRALVDIDGVLYLMVLQPLGINGWLVGSIAPQKALLAYYSRTVLGTSAIVVAACLAFLFLLLWQIRNMSNNQKALENLAYYDQLTGLRNYTKLILDTRTMLRHRTGRKYAVWSFDVKKFNNINDIFGVQKGDRVLMRIADIVKEEEDNNTLAGRIAADQFVGLRPYRKKDELTAWFDHICGELADRHVLALNEMRLDVSMGIYCVDEFPRNLTEEEMINRASIAKKEAKEMAGSQAVFFTKQMGDTLHWEAELEAGGSTALQNGEVIIHLQPKVAIQNGYRISGAEVLARWNHPQHGLVSPGEFIPLFERNGFIVELDRYIFEQACSWLADYTDRTDADIRLAVNVSRQGLLREDFLTYYSGVKRKYGIADKVLELEFTESVIFDDDARFADIVCKLRNAGFVCSIDDFGSGYSSLNVLKNLPIDVLKLDARFFKDSDDIVRERIVIANFITMAQKLSIKTVAEGVETAEQVEFLKKAGCDVVQGYIFSKPLPPADFETLAARNDGKMIL